MSSTPSPSPAPAQTPAPDVTPPESIQDQIHDFVTGVRTITDETVALAIAVGASEAIIAGFEAVGGILAAVELVWGTIEAMEIKEQIWGAQGWCYGVMGAALGLPDCPPPDWTVPGSDDPDPDAQNELNKQAFRQGVSDGRQACGGVAFRNRVLLRIAYDGQNNQTTLNALWQAQCNQMSGGSNILSLYPALSWPVPPEVPKG
jgi:hypothetical protein